MKYIGELQKLLACAYSVSVKTRHFQSFCGTLMCYYYFIKCKQSIPERNGLTVENFAGLLLVEQLQAIRNYIKTYRSDVVVDDSCSVVLKVAN